MVDLSAFDYAHELQLEVYHGSVVVHVEVPSIRVSHQADFAWTSVQEKIRKASKLDTFSSRTDKTNPSQTERSGLCGPGIIKQSRGRV